MVKDRDIYLLLFLLLLCFSLLPGVIKIHKDGHPLGSDFEYHLRLSTAWLNNENPLFDEEYFLLGSPYPPAFHLMVALFSKIFFLAPTTFMNLLQVLLLPSILISVFYLVYKKTNLYTAVLSICFLSSSIAFHDRAGQVIPQAIDILLFPLIIYAFTENKGKLFVFTSAFLVYNHGIYALLLISSLLFYSVLYDRRRLKEFGVIAVLCLPLFFIFFVASPNISAPFSTVLGPTSAQHIYFIMYPLFGIAYLGYFLSIFSFIGILYFTTKEKTEFDNILILWVVTLIPLYPFLPDRFMSYVAQPLSIISGITLYEILKTEKKRYLFLGAGFIVAFLYTLIFISNIRLIQVEWIRRLSDLLFYSYRIFR